MKYVTAALALAFVALAAPAHAAKADYIVDGDTIRLKNGVYVRFIGIDTPEVGECGYKAAKNKLDKWINGSVRLVNPDSVDDTDQYDRLLRYVHDAGRDTGFALIKKGLAKARYDSLDGYDHHPRQRQYRRADRNNPDKCD